jgi:hypothetical protein
MSWLERIRNKTHEEKVRIIKVILAVCFVLLIILWFIFAKLSGPLTERSIMDAIDNNLNIQNSNQGNE